MLSGTVWFDEIYFDVSKKDLILRENGNLLRGISQNKISIEVGIDNKGN